MAQKRVDIERNYWDKASEDPHVDTKYICDIYDNRFLYETTFSGKVLDLGCGVGRLMKKGYYGVDISEKMLLIAQNRKPDCFFTLCDGRTIPYPESFFDNVYCVLLFQHIPIEAVKQYTKEVYRVLKKGGLFVFQYVMGNENEPFSYHYSHDQIKQIYEKTGFSFVNRKKNYIHYQWDWLTVQK